ncbi:MAG: hypothetical protein QOJ16_3136, partial [Acidobacteriota bacterium]|nr:hypothetical protein [Acidobacteriota bacterium]
MLRAAFAATVALLPLTSLSA